MKGNSKDEKTNQRSVSLLGSLQSSLYSVVQSEIIAQTGLGNQQTHRVESVKLGSRDLITSLSEQLILTLDIL